VSGFAAWWDGRLAAVWDRLPRPLDPFGSFKVKMGLLVGCAITLAAFTFWIGASWQFRYALLAALVTSLAITQFLAHGMTSPLRQMTNAAGAMARGDYSRRVRATSRDEIGQLATAFNLMAADLGAADEYRRGLIANVSHELRTPITALHALLENIVDGVAEPDAETMRMALSQTARLGELVTNLLDLSRVEGGAIPLQLRPFRVDEFLHEAIEHVAISPADVRITVEVSPSDLVAVADPARLRQVVVNLVDNAIRHSPAGSRVSVLASAEEPAGLRLDVCDEGPGIPPAERERVFQRFSRGATSAGGTGLGLAIARWAVELHGGTVEVMDVRMGCRIRVALPDLATAEELV
jgi:signal transduction histidine kinase